MNQYLFLLDQAATEGGGLNFTGIIILYGAIFFIFWLFLLRPQRKKQRAVEEMQSSIEVGDNILTIGGMYGKVVDIVNDVYFVEFGTNKSVRIPINRSAISGVAEPDLTTYDDESDETEE